MENDNESQNPERSVQTEGARTSSERVCVIITVMEIITFTFSSYLAIACRRAT